MKLLTALVLGATASTTALAALIPQQRPLTGEESGHESGRYLIELAPYETRWVTEEEKWALKLVHLRSVFPSL